MMQFMRAFVKSRWALLLFLPLIVAFGIFGFNDPFSGVTGGGFVSAGSRSIGARDVTRELDNYIESVRAESGEIMSQREAAERGVAAGLVEQLKRQTVALAYADKIGVRASAAAVAEIIDGAPRFQDGLGKVDRNAIATYANGQGFDVPAFEKNLQDQITLSYLVQAATAGVSAPQILTRPLVSFLGEKRTVAVARLTPASVPPVSPPTEDDLRAFYAERAAMFAEPERRVISALSYSADDYVDKVEVGDDLVKSDYDRRIREFSTPETREIAQFSSPQRNAVQTVVDTIKQGKTLEEAVAATPGVTLTTLTVKPGDLADKAYSDTAFGLPAGESFGPMQVGELFLGVQVKSITPGIPSPLADVAESIRADLATRDAERMFNDSSEQFYDLVSGGSSLEEIGEIIGAQVSQFGPVDANGGFEDGGGSSLLERHPDALKTVFQLKSGEVGDIIEGDGERVIMRVDEIIAAHTPPFEEVRDRLDELYVAVKQVEAAEKVATDVVAAIKGGATIEAATATAKMALVRIPEPLTRNSQGQIDPAIIEVIFGLEAGVPGVARTQQGEPWVVLVDKIEPVSPDAEAQLMTQVSQVILESLNKDVGEAFERGIQREVKARSNEGAIATYLASFSKETEAE